MKIGNTSINVEALSSITKQEFIDMNKGKFLDVEKEADKLSKHFKQEFKAELETEAQPERKKKRKRK